VYQLMGHQPESAAFALGVGALAGVVAYGRRPAARATATA